MPTIGVCTSAPEAYINGLILRLGEIGVMIKFIQLPYNDLDDFQLNHEVDGIILCHSIHNRRLAITDVMDSIYDVFLRRAVNVFGEENIAVMAHDFRWPLTQESTLSKESHAKLKRASMDSFQVKQPTTFRSSAVTLICGKLDGEAQIDEDDWHRLEKFVTGVRPRSHKPKPAKLYLAGMFVSLGILALKRAMSALLDTTIIIAVIGILTPPMCLVWQIIIKRSHRRGSRYRNINVFSRHWSSFPCQQMHFKFWRQYIVNGFGHVRGPAKDIYGKPINIVAVVFVMFLAVFVVWFVSKPVISVLVYVEVKIVPLGLCLIPLLWLIWHKVRQAKKPDHLFSEPWWKYHFVFWRSYVFRDFTKDQILLLVFSYLLSVFILVMKLQSN